MRVNTMTYSIPDNVKKKLYEVNPRSIVYLFSGGKDSSLALLLTRDFVRDLCSEVKCRVYILYVLIPGNTHPLNTYASSLVMEWHKKYYGFNTIYKCVNVVFQEYIIEHGLHFKGHRLCFHVFKDQIFREVENILPKPLVEVDGMSPNDSRLRARTIKEELMYVETYHGTRYWSWHPLYNLKLSSEEKLNILKQYPEFNHIVRLYEVFGDSLNCVFCPYRELPKYVKYDEVEDFTIINEFINEYLKERKIRKRFSKLNTIKLDEWLK